jgi:ATP-dependent helicase/nuclease subunit A
VASGEEALRLLYVAMTRAQDHLILGCYHKPAGGQPTHAQRLVRLLPEASGLVRVEPSLSASPEGVDMAAPAEATAFAVAGSHADFDTARGALLAGVARRTATTPTALVAANAAVDPEPERPDVEDVDSPGSDGAGSAEDAGPTWRRSGRRGRGAAIGTAVHRVLELVDPADSTENLRRLAEFACDESGIPDLVDDVVGRVGTALASPAVAQALRDGRAWREVYLVVPDGERVVEGYVDLLTDDGEQLTVLDYKTDRAATEEERAAKEAYYAPQLAEYVRMVEAVTGRNVSAGLVFASPATEAENSGER